MNGKFCCIKKIIINKVPNISSLILVLIDLRNGQKIFNLLFKYFADEERHQIQQAYLSISYSVVPNKKFEISIQAKLMTSDVATPIVRVGYDT